MPHQPKLGFNGFSCCGFPDDLSTRWYVGGGYSIAASSHEEAAAVVRSGAGRDLKKYHAQYNTQTRSHLALILRSGIHLEEKCLKEL